MNRAPLMRVQVFYHLALYQVEKDFNGAKEGNKLSSTEFVTKILYPTNLVPQNGSKDNNFIL